MVNNVVIDGIFKDCKWDLSDVFKIVHKIPLKNYDFPDDPVTAISHKSITSWNYYKQLSPDQYVIDVYWNSDYYKNPEKFINKEYVKKLYKKFLEEGTKSTLIVDGEYFGYFNKWFFEKRTDLTEEEKQEFLAEVRKQQTIASMLEPDPKIDYSVPDTKPRCPTCNSTNIRKIDGFERGTSVLMLGMFSKKINKTFKCNSCGHTW